MDMSSDNLEGFFCSRPFNNVEYHLDGNVYFCCPSWIKTPIGNLKNSSIEDMWNSNEAHAVRASILDGSYSYCRKEICPYIQAKDLPRIEHLPLVIKEAVENKKVEMDNQPEHVMLVHDDSCNLSCPSCRTTKISHSPGSERSKQIQAYSEKIFDYHLKRKDCDLHLNMTGSGDPFASTAFRQFLVSIEGAQYPNLKIDFQTNGVLLTPLMWNNMKNIHKNIHHVWVSIDAAEEETYAIIRRGGNWKILNENMQFLAKLREKNQIDELNVNMVVQKGNYKEMVQFAQKYLEMGCDRINFSSLNDWGTWPHDEFLSHCVHFKNHPEHEQFLKLLEDDVFEHQRVKLGNLSSFHTLAKSRLDPTYIPKSDRVKNEESLINLQTLNKDDPKNVQEYLRLGFWKGYHLYCIFKGIGRNLKTKFFR